MKPPYSNQVINREAKRILARLQGIYIFGVKFDPNNINHLLVAAHYLEPESLEVEEDDRTRVLDSD